MNVFDGTSDTLAEGMSGLVEGNLIKRVAKGEIEARDDATVIDSGGRTLMPGMIDNHVHFNITGGLAFSYEGLQTVKWNQIAIQSAANAKDHLMDGFTTVRDAFGMDDGLQQMIDRGIVEGPRIYPSGACIGPTSGHSDARDPASRTTGELTQLERLGIVAIADSPDEVRLAVRRNLSNGAALIKMMSGGGVSSSLDPLYSNAN